MSIKHLFAAGFVTIFSTAIAMIGCAVDSALDAEDEAVSENTDAVSVAVNCGFFTKTGLATPSYERAVTASATTPIIAVDGKSTVYDVSALARDRLNPRRRTTHTKGTQTIKPYYNLYYTGGAPAVVPAYGAINIKIDETNTNYGSSACRLCKAMSEVATSGHPGFGECSGSWNPTTGVYDYGTSNFDVSVGSCGAAFGPGVTAQSVVDSCLNTFESEVGPSAGHKGAAMVFDAPGRSISAIIAVYVNGGTTTAEIRFDYSYPNRTASQPNGASCKLKGECLSNRCNGTTGRCEGFASSVKAGGTTTTAGVSTCPPADSRNCTEHPEDAALCFSKNLACASGTCNVVSGVGTCAKGATGKPCATAADCLSNVCNGTGKTCG